MRVVVLAALLGATACVSYAEKNRAAPMLHPVDWYLTASTDALTLAAKEVGTKRRYADACTMGWGGCSVVRVYDYEITFESTAFCALNAAERELRLTELCVRVFDRENEFADIAPTNVRLLIRDPTGVWDEARKECSFFWRCA